MEELKKITKQCLSIIEASIIKDKEIEMLIKAGIADLKRQGINASEKTEDSLLQSAIVMFVKSNFGNTDIKEKELAQKTYSLLCNNLSLSLEYKIEDKEVDNNA